MTKYVVQEGVLVKVEEAEAEDMKYVVVMLGGSIGEKSVRSKRDLKGKMIDKKIHILYDSKEEAEIVKKRMNSHLSPGEKKYYGINYTVAKVINNKFTGE